MFGLQPSFSYALAVSGILLRGSTGFSGLYLIGMCLPLISTIAPASSLMVVVSSHPMLSERGIGGLLLHFEECLHAVAYINQIPCLTAVSPHNEILLGVVYRLPHQCRNHLGGSFVLRVFTVGVDDSSPGRLAILPHAELYFSN